MRWTLIVFLLPVLPRARALSIPIQQRQISASIALNTTRWGTARIDNLKDLKYTTSVMVRNTTKHLLIDTGSSDMWARGIVANTTDQPLRELTLNYGNHSVTGHINAAIVSLANYAIDNQAYIQVTTIKELGDIDEVIGIGPFDGSDIAKMIPQLNPGPFPYRVFAQNATAPAFISFFFSRTETLKVAQEDPTPPPTSQITIGEVIPGFDKILTYPKIPVQRPPNPSQKQRWNIEIEQIRGPRNTPLNLVPTVRGAAKLIARLDTGYSFSQLPKNAVDAIYSNITGAAFDPLNFWWTIPCKSEVNITFKIQGFDYIIHPLDTSLMVSGPGGRMTCIGTFQPRLLTSFGDAEDIILGDNFFRNTYTLLNYGNFISPSVSDTSEITNRPYVQLYPMTTQADSHRHFETIRLKSGAMKAGGTSKDLLKFFVFPIAVLLWTL